MIWTKPHGVEAKDQVFLNCEYRGTTAAIRGDTVVWDTTAAAVSDDALGVGVVASYPVANLALVAGVLEQAAAAQPNIATVGVRGPMVLVQCFGYHDKVQLSAGAGGAGTGILVTGSTLGKATADASVTTTAEVIGAFGYLMETYGSPGAYKCMIKAM